MWFVLSGALSKAEVCPNGSHIATVLFSRDVFMNVFMNVFKIALYARTRFVLFGAA